MKKFTLITFALMGFLFLNAQDTTYTDMFAADFDFVTATDYSTSIWEGMNVNTSGNDNNITELTGLAATGGELWFESRNGAFAGEDVRGAYVYRTVPGGIDFSAELKVTGGSFVSFDSTAYHNSVGIMVRNPSYAVSNHIFAHLFELWGFHNILKSTIDGTQTEVEVANGSLDLFPSLTAYPYIRLTRAGNMFTVAVSADTFTWTDCSSVERTDMAGIDLEVGIGQCNYDGGGGMTAAKVDNFKLTHAAPVGISQKLTENSFKAYSVDNQLFIESEQLIQSSKLYSIVGREVASMSSVRNNRVEFSNLNAGIYIAEVNIDGIRMTKKVVVQ